MNNMIIKKSGPESAVCLIHFSIHLQMIILVYKLLLYAVLFKYKSYAVVHTSRTTGNMAGCSFVLAEKQLHNHG